MILSFKDLKNISHTLSLLYVEDDQTLRETTARIFKNIFMCVDIAVDGQDGLNMYRDYYQKNNKYYDIIVSDIQMLHIKYIIEIYIKSENNFFH